MILAAGDVSSVIDKDCLLAIRPIEVSEHLLKTSATMIRVSRVPLLQVQITFQYVCCPKQTFQDSMRYTKSKVKARFIF